MGDELSPRPPFLGTLQATPRPYPRKVVQSSTLDRADADTRPLPPPPSFPPPRSSPLRPSRCPLPLLRGLLAAFFPQRLLTAGRYISRTTKFLGPRNIVRSIPRYLTDHRQTYRTFILACQHAGKGSLRHRRSRLPFHA